MNAPAILSNDDAFRASVVGASEVAALFGASPWLTHFELWHRKNGTIATPDFDALDDNGVPENERVYWGVRLEPAIIEAAKERYGYTDREQLARLDNGKGLGGHPDRRVICPERGPGILEVKMVDWIIRKSWGDEPPLNYLLQSQAYQGLDGVAWGDVLVLVGGNKLERFCYDFRPKIYADIERRVEAFWASVRAGKAPKPDYSRDLAAVIDTIGTPDDTVIDLSRDNRADLLASEWLEAKAAEKAAKARAVVAQCELLTKIGTAGAAMLLSHRIGCNQTRDSAGTLITPEHVGTTLGARKGYRRFDIKEI
jgi:predicted phage-related endonuclease